MDDKHNFAGYITYNHEEYFCTVNNYFVKMFPKIKYGINKDDSERNWFGKTNELCKKYLFGDADNVVIKESSLSEKRLLPFAVLMTKFPRTNHDSEYLYFSTPVIIRGLSSTINFSGFSGIEFYGETVNKIYNPRKAVKHSRLDAKTKDMKMENEIVGFTPHSDCVKEFDVIINEQKTKLQYTVYRYIHLAEQKNEDGSISLGSVNSAVRIWFENKQPLDELFRYYQILCDFLSFLTGRQNVGFGVRLFQEINSYKPIAECFFNNEQSSVYNGKIHETIQIEDFGDKFSEVFSLFVDKKTAPSLRFLPENNKMQSRISFADILNICTAFEIEYELCEIENKNNTVNDYEYRQCDKSDFCDKFERKNCDNSNYCWKKGTMLAKIIWFLYQQTIDSTCENGQEEDRKKICNFTLLRNDISHTNSIEWGECANFFSTLVKSLYVLVLLRADIEKAAAIKITEGKWRA